MNDITFKWRVYKIRVVPRIGRLEKVIRTVHYEVAGINERTGDVDVLGGEVRLPDPDAATFRPFEMLNEERVLEWTRLAIGTATVADHERELRANLGSLSDPEEVEVMLPWSADSDEKVILFKNKGKG